MSGAVAGTMDSALVKKWFTIQDYGAHACGLPLNGKVCRKIKF